MNNTKIQKNKNITTDFRGLNVKKNYSSFWMDHSNSKFSGLATNANYTSDLVKLIKLSNYRRAITNFVKIVTKQEIPVKWHGNTSFTDGKSITLSTDIKDDNFDVTVGLALHEASHIIMSDFASLSKVLNGMHDRCNAVIKHYQLEKHGVTRRTVANMLNWIEDRRIDNYIFSTSPGYKAYYHKLYEYYWNDPIVLKGLKSADARQSTLSCYEFHIMNMISAGFDPQALPGLAEIAEYINLPKIGRLKSTSEALDVTLNVLAMIGAELDKAQADLFDNSNTTQNSTAGSNTDSSESAEPNTTTADTTQKSDKNTKASNKKSNSNTEENSENTSGSEGNQDTPAKEEAPQLTAAEKKLLEKAINKQQQFLSGNIDKKAATKNLARDLEDAAKTNYDIQQVKGGNNKSIPVLIISLTPKESEIAHYAALGRRIVPTDWKMSDEVRKKVRDANTPIQEELEKHRNSIPLLQSLFFETHRLEQSKGIIQKALDQGALLGKRLTLHNESRERVDTRLIHGKIDNRRLAHAGYDIENVFKQMQVDKHKAANLHISIDGSGSMDGVKWDATVQLTITIAKAIQYTQNINVQVSIRDTWKGDARAILAYDSKKNKLQHLINILSLYVPQSTTPEGLCFEAMIKKNMFVKGTSQLDSYFLNISDGMPSLGNSTYHVSDYYVPQNNYPITQTAAQVNTLRSEYNMQILSFFMTTGMQDYAAAVSRFNNTADGRMFKAMYGRDAAVVDPNNVLSIAKALNSKFMSK